MNRRLGFTLLLATAVLAGCQDWSWDFGKSYKVDSFPTPEAKGDYRAYADELEITVFVAGNKEQSEPIITNLEILADGKPMGVRPKLATGFGKNGFERMVMITAPQVAGQVKAVLEVEYIQRLFQIAIRFDRTAEANWVAGIAETKYLRKVEKENK